MPERVSLRYDRELSQPLSWQGGKKADGTRTAIAKCANGHISSLSEHDIDDDGNVNPSLVCPYDDCTWHEYAVLEGWNNHVKNS